MEKIAIEKSELKPFEKRLALKWEIRYFLAPGEATCRIVCDAKNRVHEIWINKTAARGPVAQPDIIHELCHAALAERIDPAFSSIYFTKRCGELTGEDRREFYQRGRMLYCAWSHTDIWVNDLRHELWPELTISDHQSYADGFLALLRSGNIEFICMTENLLGLAQYQAERERHSSGGPDLFSVPGIRIGREIAELAEFFKSLPRLKFKPRKDLKLLAKSVSRAAKILKLPIDPRMVYENGQWVWDV